MQGNFWKLSSPDIVRGLADCDESFRLEQVFCSADPNHRRAGKQVADPIVLLTSKRITDFIWTWGNNCLIQDYVLQLFRKEGFTGFDVKPVKAHMKIRVKKPDPCDETPGVKPEIAREVKIPKLWELVVTGWGGIAPPESGVKLIKSCSACGLLEYSDFTNPSHLINESQWDGSDFFMVWPLPGFIFVTDRVDEFIHKKKLIGVRLQRPNELKPATVSAISPGRLSYWMPESRARELGEPLGIY